MAIQRLQEKTIAQIAAGEVVERPASVVKELIENALDADASSIHVEVQGGGRRLIRISDDGSGIGADEIALAFAQHATSKLREVEDLSSIRTLGFRGEALSSIAAVSIVQMVSRHRDEKLGMQVRIEGGTIVQQQPTGAPAGTVITVENLFYNTPARLKFLNKETTEKRHITALVTRYAMAYPQVKFVLEQDRRELFRSNGSGALADVMLKVIGLDNFRQMVEVDGYDAAREGRPAVRVTGYTSMPGFNRADRSHIALFVNGRSIQDTRLTYAVSQAYHSLLEANRFPVAAIMIEIDSQEVDVNVHPTKAEVRFRDLDAVFSAVQRAVREAIMAYDRSIPRIAEPSMQSQPRWEDRPTAQLDLDLEEDDPLTAIPEGPGRPVKPRTLPVLRVVGQVGAMYIVTEGPAGMYLIDQRAAHERILYEQFMEGYVNSTLPVRQINTTQPVELSAEQAGKVESALHVFEALGFKLEPFGPSAFVVRSVPEIVAHIDYVALLREMAVDTRVENRLIINICQHAAVKSGQILNQEAMQNLIRQLERCQTPLEAPDGRATLVHLSGDQLAHEFVRATGSATGKPG